MFKKQKDSPETSLFTGFGQTLGAKKMKRIEDKKSWDNIFREEVSNRIDEEIFSLVYNEGVGRPNAPVRVLVSMMVLKEGFGWSDSELYEECRFNLLVMNALGLTNVSDEVPVESTYYDFKKKIYEYQISTGRSLIAEACEDTTKTQAKIYSVNAKWIRMDSKLIGSNIAKCTRLQLIINCLQEFYKSIDESIKAELKEKERKILEELMKKKAYQIVFELNNKEKEEWLSQLGKLLSRLIERYKDRDKKGGMGDGNKYKMIVRIFKEQYQKTGKGIEVKTEDQIPSDAIQSPYDMEAAYRKKGDMKVRGYSINIVETCNKNELNLIVGTEVYKANKSDSELLEEGVSQAERVCGKVEKISVDGAYHSPGNQNYARDNGKVIHLSGITGAGGDYDFEDSEGELKVRNKETGEEIVAHVTKKGHYRIKQSDGKRRYFTKEQIESYRKRKEVEQLPREIRNVRCNVEATIFQSCVHLKKNKTKYRGWFNTHLWARFRIMWMNMIRIKKYNLKLYLEEQKMIARLA